MKTERPSQAKTETGWCLRWQPLLSALDSPSPPSPSSLPGDVSNSESLNVPNTNPTDLREDAKGCRWASYSHSRVGNWHAETHDSAWFLKASVLNVSRVEKPIPVLPGSSPVPSSGCHCLSSENGGLL